MQKKTLLLSLLLLGVTAFGCRNSVTPKKSPKQRDPAQPATAKSVVELRHTVVNGSPGAMNNKKAQRPASVGMPAPDFELPAYHKGKFKKVKLSDYRGKWVLLCFYPGDFTFV